MSQLEEFKEEATPYFNTLVLDGNRVVILLDIIEEPEDLYCKFEGQLTGKKGVYLSSCVGWFTPLKGKLDDKEYESLVRTWNLNYENKAI